ncbi:metal-sulfur cluster assembly factor [Ligilactobacillus sp. WILCCON 0076]|uniref:Metal-sulfur cluster assembly factor n=1 Tax=Ligilactobacillus ubinensis TaxID=2876789 RepID=A0A9X2FRJ1_9LACO|nr:metal-sulfur cluster assembly factor [Ligilactobacillus ubinensis]MCP0887718.1 metal-sulfur cluster assembly factor [Ligilactobacillus ubinensis]
MAEIKNNEALKAAILDALEEVIDPELGVDIVNLGLVYEINVSDKGECEIQMTLTTMGCPLTDLLADMVERSLNKISEITAVEVKFVWEPAWTMDRMSRYAKMALGIH